MRAARRGDGWAQMLLTDEHTGAGLPMRATRWVLQPAGHTPELAQGEAETMLYVIRGSGVVLVGGTRHPLEAETVLWLEPGDRYRLEAGPKGLELLEGTVRG